MKVTFSPRSKVIMFIVLLGYIIISLSGCSGSSSSEARAVLNVVLNTSVLSRGSNGQRAALPIEASKFHIEVLDESGREIDFIEVDRILSADSLTVTFSIMDTGSYRVRVSAFDANQVILGTSNEQVVISAGENTISVNSVQAAEVYFTPSLNLPQTKNSEAFTNFLSFDQSGIHLQSYCLWGKLVEDGKPVNAYLSIVQRLDQEIPDFGSYMFPIVIAGVGYSNEQTAHIIFGGSYGIAELTEAVVVTQPWHVYVESLNSSPTPFLTNTTEMMVLSGTMGQAGAQYEITSRTKDLEGGALETNVVVTDVMGFVNEGYGPASFFPQWLLPDQRDIIAGNTYNGSVGDYLKATCNPMTDQGSYYYSAPILQVDSFSITRNDQVVSQGHDGLLWMDVVFQSFDSAAQDVVKTATWNFFSIQFPQSNRALMVTNIHNDSNGGLSVASLFSTTATRSANGALNPEFRWNLQDIEITPVPGHTWTSQSSNLTYNTQYNITLSGTRQANLVVTMAWNEQELQINNTVKYEGYANVSGTLDGENVQGAAWVELQPAGHL